MADYITIDEVRRMIANNPQPVDKKAAAQMALDDMTPGQRILASIGSGMADLNPFRSREEVDEKRIRDAELNDTFGAKALNLAGQVIPTLAVPFGTAAKVAGAGLKAAGAAKAGAAIGNSAAADMILTGMGLGAAAPVGTGDSRLENMMWGGAGGAVIPAAGATFRAGKALVEPFTNKGAQRVAGRALTEAGLPSNLRVEEIVLGSRPSTVEATQSPTLAQIQKTLANKNPNFRADLDTLAAEQNLARWNALNDVTGTADDITAAVAAREAKAMPILDSAMGKARKPDTQALVDVADMLGGGSTRLRTNASDALGTIRDKLSQSRSASDLYAVRQEIDDMLSGRVGDVNKGARYAGEELMQMKGAIDDALNQATGGKWTKYLEAYTEGSKPVNRMEASQKFASSFRAAAPDQFGVPTINHARWRQAMESSVPVFGGGSATTRTQLGDTLNVGQMDMLNDIERDLMRSYQAQKLVSARGSDTMQNIEGSGILEALLRGAPKPAGTSGILGSMLDSLASARSRKPMAELEKAMLSPSYAMQLAKQANVPQAQVRSLLDSGVEPALLISEIARMSAARALPAAVGQ